MRARRVKRSIFLLITLLVAIPAFADSMSLTGTLATDPNDVLLISFSLSAAGSVTMQSFGYGVAYPFFR